VLFHLRHPPLLARARVLHRNQHSPPRDGREGGVRNHSHAHTVHMGSSASQAAPPRGLILRSFVYEPADYARALRTRGLDAAGPAPSVQVLGDGECVGPPLSSFVDPETGDLCVIAFGGRDVPAWHIWRARDGALRWRIPSGHDFEGGIAVFNPTGGRPVASLVNSDGSAITWAPEGGQPGGPALPGVINTWSVCPVGDAYIAGVVVVRGGRGTGIVRAFDGATLAEVVAVHEPPVDGEGVCLAAASSDHVAFADRQGEVVVFAVGDWGAPRIRIPPQRSRGAGPPRGLALFHGEARGACVALARRHGPLTVFEVKTGHAVLEIEQRDGEWWGAIDSIVCADERTGAQVHCLVAESWDCRPEPTGFLRLWALDGTDRLVGEVEYPGTASAMRAGADGAHVIMGDLVGSRVRVVPVPLPRTLGDLAHAQRTEMVGRGEDAYELLVLEAMADEVVNQRARS
jgi:hypothetical protein